jgi:hypothetical protein
VEALKLGRRARPPTPDAFRGQADPNGVISCEDFSCSDRVSQGEINKITSLEKSQTAVSFDHIHLGSNCCVVLPEPPGVILYTFLVDLCVSPSPASTNKHGVRGVRQKDRKRQIQERFS